MRTFIISAVTAAGLLGTAAAAVAQTVKVGVIGILTGPGAAWGIAGLEGLRLAAEDANAAGGIEVNGTRRKVELVAYDDQYKASEAVAAYNRLLNENGIKYVVTMSSASTMALKSSIEADDVLVLTTATSGKIVDADTRHIVTMYSLPKDYAPPIIRWMRSNVEGSRVAFVYPNDETGWDFTQMATDGFKAAGYDVVSRDLFDRAQKDFQPLLTRLLAQQPDLIDLGPTSPPTAGLIIRQARELGYKKAFSALGGSGPRDIVAAAGPGTADGTVVMLYADSNNPAYKALSERYRAKYGQLPNELIAPYYDGMTVLLKAMSLSGAPDDPGKVHAAFAKALPMKSFMGEPLVLGGGTPGGNQIMTVDQIGVIRNGEPVAVAPAR